MTTVSPHTTQVPPESQSAAQTLTAFFDAFVPLVEAEMRDVVNHASQPSEFSTMLNYHLGFAQADGTPASVYSGKRIRPILVLLSCETCGGDASQAIPAAAAVELLHNFSLIHDDIEDRDELRRGRPTLWKQWGEAQAINTGDAMFAQAHLALHRCAERGVPASHVFAALRVFDAMCVHLTIGQHLDLSFETRTDVTVAEYMRMIEGKTAALTQACCEIGAIIAGASTQNVQTLADFGRWLGLSFQLQDDVLGIWGDPQKTGKQDSDLAHGKKTLPILYAAERNAAIRSRYFANTVRSEDDIAEIKRMIEATGARAHAEQAASSAYASGLEALDGLGDTDQGKRLLRTLAQSLLGRAQ